MHVSYTSEHITYLTFATTASRTCHSPTSGTVGRRCRSTQTLPLTPTQPNPTLQNHYGSIGEGQCVVGKTLSALHRKRMFKGCIFVPPPPARTLQVIIGSVLLCICYLGCNIFVVDRPLDCFEVKQEPISSTPSSSNVHVRGRDEYIANIFCFVFSLPR